MSVHVRLLWSPANLIHVILLIFGSSGAKLVPEEQNINNFVHVVQINMVIQNDNNLVIKSFRSKDLNSSFLLKIKILLLSH